jgi:hypothetical protein
VRLRARTLAALLLASSCGCARKAAAPAPRVVDLRVAEESGGEAPDGAALAQRIAERMRAAGVAVALDGAEPRPGADYRLKASYLSGAGDAPCRMRARIVEQLTRIGGEVGEPPIESRVVADRDLPGCAPGAALPPAALRAHLERALDDATQGLVAALRLHVADRREVEAALRGSDEGLRAEAIRVSAARKDATLVPPLVALLSSEDRAVRDEALGALVEIGDRRAVKPISRIVRFQETDELPKVIDALGALGGDEARAYLEFVLSAHDDPEIRTLAREALGRMER